MLASATASVLPGHKRDTKRATAETAEEKLTSRLFKLPGLDSNQQPSG